MKVTIVISVLLLALAAWGQTSTAPEQGSADPVAIFPHPDNTRWFVAG